MHTSQASRPLLLQVVARLLSDIFLLLRAHRIAARVVVVQLLDVGALGHAVNGLRTIEHGSGFLQRETLWREVSFKREVALDAPLTCVSLKNA